jgi:hypothetical protein
LQKASSQRRNLGRLVTTPSPRIIASSLLGGRVTRRVPAGKLYRPVKKGLIATSAVDELHTPDAVHLAG